MMHRTCIIYLKEVDSKAICPLMKQHEEAGVISRRPHKYNLQDSKAMSYQYLSNGFSRTVAKENLVEITESIGLENNLSVLPLPSQACILCLGSLALLSAPPKSTLDQTSLNPHVQQDMIDLYFLSLKMCSSNIHLLVTNLQFR